MEPDSEAKLDALKEVTDEVLGWMGLQCSSPYLKNERGGHWLRPQGRIDFSSLAPRARRGL